MTRHRTTATLAAALLLATTVTAQVSRLGSDIGYKAEISGTLSDGDYAPLWLTANRYGLSSVENNAAYLRLAAARSVTADSLRRWRIGYGIDLAVPVNFTSNFVVQQLYADVQWRALRLTIGAKEMPDDLKNAALSSGGLSQSTNARPVPQVRLALPDFWVIPGTRSWLAIKGHIAFGRFTDDNWQEDVHPQGGLYAKGVLYHSKAGYLRIGNERKFPLSLTAGLEMKSQFGGEAWNVGRRDDDATFDNSHVKAGSGFKSFWHALVPGGDDAFDGDYKNSEGNTLGSWHFRLDYKGHDWSVAAYAEHFFEDHSQMFLQYGWKDMLWGIEANLPKNPIVTTVLYEHLRTTDQTGGVYHDETATLPVQISGVDNYYNHSFYGAWQHWGQAMGNPLLVSPVYNADGSITFRNNRVTAHHAGISGQPLPALSYRLLYSHVRSLGTYASPLTNPAHGNYYLAEAAYTLPASGWTFKAAVAGNGGTLLGNSFGGMLTVTKTGIFNLTKKNKR